MRQLEVAYQAAVLLKEALATHGESPILPPAVEWEWKAPDMFEVYRPFGFRIQVRFDLHMWDVKVQQREGRLWVPLYQWPGSNLTSTFAGIERVVRGRLQDMRAEIAALLEQEAEPG